MHGRFFQTRLKSRIADALGVQDNVPRQPRRRNIQSGQEMIVSVGNGLTMMRWGMMPDGPINARGRLEMETIIKARSETVFNKCAFESVGCAVIPVDDWYEWTPGKSVAKPPGASPRRTVRQLGHSCLTSMVVEP